MGTVWFTADPHFGADSSRIIEREMRPFKNALDYADQQIQIWNEQILLQHSKNDTIYVIGDFCNYNAEEKDFYMGLAISRQIRADIILIAGNNEERIVTEQFDGSFERFREFCLDKLNFNFADIKRRDYVTIGGTTFCLTHKPTDHDKHCATLFGHVHRAGGVWRLYGLNVGVDLNHFRLYKDTDITNLMEQKRRWWDSDPDNNCFSGTSHL